MSTLLASTSQADSGNTTSGVVAFDASDTIVATIANGSTPPSQFAQVTLQLSGDNGTTWKSVETKWAGGAPSFTYSHKFHMADYAGAVAQSNGYSTWTQARLFFFGNVGAAVTVAASDSDPVEVAVVTLAGTTSTAGGGIAAWAPPGGGPIVITDMQIYCSANSTGAANISAGVAANATTSGAGLVNAQALAAAANTTIPSGTGTSAARSAVLTGAKCVTFTGSADTTGFSGKAFISYVRP